MEILRWIGIPVGRYNLRISYVGYDPVVIPEVLVESGKQVVLSAELKESATTLQQVEVRAFGRKDQAVNSMAMISATAADHGGSITVCRRH